VEPARPGTGGGEYEMEQSTLQIQMPEQRSSREPRSAALPAGRLASLDVLRGLTLIGMMLVNYADGLKSLGYRVYPQLLHSSWAGFHFADSVFPAFVVMTGVSIPIANRATQLDRATLRKITARTLRLILIGIVISNLIWMVSLGDGVFRPEGVLQRIAIAYCGAVVLYLGVGPRWRLLSAAALLLIYWPLCCLPVPDGVESDLLVRGANFSSWVDRALLGKHIYVQSPFGFDPEGLLGMLPAIAQALIGVAAGEWIQARKDPRPLALAGAAMIAVGLAWGLTFPIVKALWSSSFVLLSSGITIVVLAALYWAMDLRGWRSRIAQPAADFGMNSIVAYCLHEALTPLLGVPGLKQIYAAAAPLLGKPTAALIPSLLVILLIWGVLYFMRLRRWIIRV
jgi:predicted acyltransferase